MGDPAPGPMTKKALDMCSRSWSILCTTVGGKESLKGSFDATLPDASEKQCTVNCSEEHQHRLEDEVDVDMQQVHVSLEECFICKSDEDTHDLVATNCGHIYHASCLGEWWKSAYVKGIHRTLIRECSYCTQWITGVTYLHHKYPCNHEESLCSMARVVDKGYSIQKVPPPPPCTQCARYKGAKPYPGLFLELLSASNGEKGEYAEILHGYQNASHQGIYWEEWERLYQKRFDVDDGECTGFLITKAELAFVLDCGRAMCIEHVFQQLCSRFAAGRKGGVAEDIKEQLRWFSKDAAEKGFAACFLRNSWPRTEDGRGRSGRAIRCQSGPGCDCEVVKRWFDDLCSDLGLI